MDPFRHNHRKAVKGLCSPSFSWFPLRHFITEASILETLRTIRASSSIARTLKTAHPDYFTSCKTSLLNFPFGLNSILLDQVLDRLVSSSSKRYRSFTDDLSPGSLPGVLLLSNGTLILEVGFTLRCLQRLSHPHFASLLCRWHDNSCTSDASTPVLSY